MNYKRTIKQIALRIPSVKELVNERDALKDLNAKNTVTLGTLEKDNKRLRSEIHNSKNPLLAQDYKFATNPLFQITEADINQSNLATTQKLEEIKTANWILPEFKVITFGGLYTIFRAVEKLSIENVKNRIVINSNSDFDVVKLQTQISENFPNLQNYEIIAFDYKKEDPDKIPASDIAFCTIWETAYILLRFNKTKRKYYFIQDYEPMFFPAGAISALSESTYRFGFKGIVNTPGLLKEIQSRHKMEATFFTPGVDKKLYHPNELKNNKQKDSKKIKIFFYARPTKPRNAFNLGIETIKQLLDKYEGRIEIVTAGAEWNEADYNLENKVTNLGLLKTLNEVADLYRTCDIGLCFMLTRHPSYQPIEYMTSGIATVVNMNETNLWLLENRRNCLISEPSPRAMASAIGELIDSPKLRNDIVHNGLETVKDYSWDKQMNLLWKSIKET